MEYVYAVYQPHTYTHTGTHAYIHPDLPRQAFTVADAIVHVRQRICCKISAHTHTNTDTHAHILQTSRGRSETYHVNVKRMTQVYALYQHEMHKRNAVDNDDLLMCAVWLVEKHAHVRKGDARVCMHACVYICMNFCVCTLVLCIYIHTYKHT
jgi:superfamily I DNA/RNA helicase